MAEGAEAFSFNAIQFITSNGPRKFRKNIVSLNVYSLKIQRSPIQINLLSNSLFYDFNLLRFHLIFRLKCISNLELVLFY